MSITNEMCAQRQGRKYWPKWASCVTILFLAFHIVSQPARGQDTLTTIRTIEVGTINLKTAQPASDTEHTGEENKGVYNVRRANQGIASDGSKFFTSGSVGVQLDDVGIFGYPTFWNPNNSIDHEVLYNSSLDHIGDIAVNGSLVFAPLSDFHLGTTRRNILHITWFRSDTLAPIAYLDVSHWAQASSYNIDKGDLAGVAIRDGRLFVVEYQASATPRVFALPLNGTGGVPTTSSMNVYPIRSKYANGIAFQSEYMFVAYDPTDNDGLGLLDIYTFSSLSESSIASPVKTYKYGSDSFDFRYPHAEGLTFNGSELWVADDERVREIQNPIPLAPTGISATDGDYTDRVHIDWTSVSGASGYRVYRSTSNDSSSASFIFSSATSSGFDTNVAPGQTYYYWAKSTRDVGGATLRSVFSSANSGYASQTLSISPSNRNHTSSSSTGNSISVTSNVSWSASDNRSWINITSGSSGSNNGTIQYSVSSNSSTTSRSGTITVTGGGITRTFTVNQDGAGNSLQISPSNRNHTSSSSTGNSISVTSNVSWSASDNRSWINITSGSSGSNNGTIQYSVSSNSSTSSRSGTITVTGGGITRTFTVSQAGAGNSLQISPSSRNHTSSSSTGNSISVTSNVSWSASDNQSWITITSGTSGSNNGTIQYSVSSNSSTSSRSGTITVTGGGITRTFTVSQDGVGNSLQISPTSRNHASSSSTGNSISVTSNVSWSASDNRSWINITSGSSDSNNGTILYNVTSNSSTTSRSGTITVTGGGITQTFTVSQAGVGNSLQLSIDSSTGNVNEVVRVPLRMVTNGTRPVAMSFSLNFSSADVSVDGVDIGPAAENAGKRIDYGLHEGKISVVVSYGSQYMSDGVFAYINFRILRDTPNRTIPLTPSEESAASPDASAIPVNFSAGSISVGTLGPALEVSPSIYHVEADGDVFDVTITNVGGEPASTSFSNPCDWIWYYTPVYSSLQPEQQFLVRFVVRENAGVARSCQVTFDVTGPDGGEVFFEIRQQGETEQPIPQPETQDPWEGFKSIDSTLTENVFPIPSIKGEATPVTSQKSLYVRVTGNSAIQPSAIYANAETSRGAWPIDAAWVAIPDSQGADGWVVVTPLEPFSIGDVVTLMVDARTVDDQEIETIVEQFVIGQDKDVDYERLEPAVIEDEEFERLPDILAASASPVYRIVPEGPYSEPLQVLIPLPSDESLKDLQVYYFSESVRHAGWYLGENVAGWIVPGSQNVVMIDGEVYIQIFVNHSGVFQLGKVFPVEFGGIGAIDISTDGTREDWLVVIGLLALIFLGIFRLKRRSSAYGTTRSGHLRNTP